MSKKLLYIYKYIYNKRSFDMDVDMVRHSCKQQPGNVALAIPMCVYSARICYTHTQRYRSYPQAELKTDNDTKKNST